VIRSKGAGAWRDAVGRRLHVLALLGSVFGAIAFLPDWHWAMGLLAPFRLQYAALGVFGLTWACWLQQWRWGAVHGLGLAPQAVAIALSLPAPVQPGELVFRLLAINIHRETTDARALLELVERERPDALLVLELAPALVAALEGLSQTYPHRLIEARDDNFGVGLWLRSAPVAAELIELDGQLPAVAARLETAAGELRLIGVHAFPPLGAWASTQRRLLHQRLSELVRSEATPVLVAGDFNATPWCVPMRELLAQTGLVDAIGPRPTWRAAAWAWPLALPLDHALHSPALSVRRAEVGPDVGSDHRPLIIELGG
jgi:endonuclease/exonuclease/phosphatase (EEP) superfamily protein YafD